MIETETPGRRGLSPVLARYDALARRAGLDRLHLLLSFDCDTDLDPAAALEIEPLLKERGVKATFAVPGAQLRKAAATYRGLAERGAVFINHGAAPHAEFVDGRWRGCSFYAKMTADEARADIREGHRVVRETTGQTPRGFRTGHFGCFQEPEQLALVHETLAELGYAFSSSTVPAKALERGPWYDVGGGLLEIPTFGTWASPESLLDSWSHLTDRVDYALGDSFFDLFAETVDRLTAAGVAGILNYYVDPAHVAGQAPFRRALEHAVKRDVPTLDFDDVPRLAGRAG